jgi:hypothetical protein
MNWAHAHLLLNHVPVLGTVFALAVLIYGTVIRNRTVQRLGLGAFVLVALASLPAFFTGEPAEAVVERAAGVTEGAVDAHEDSAAVSLIAVEVLGALALIGLALSRKERPLPGLMVATTLVTAFAAGGLMARTANLGGHIRHAEIRAGPAAAPGPAERDEGDHDGR